ncbi:hypothetical protein AMECASPLE_036487, partial [Ameca splendens]
HLHRKTTGHFISLAHCDFGCKLMFLFSYTLVNKVTVSPAVICLILSSRGKHKTCLYVPLSIQQHSLFSISISFCLYVHVVGPKERKDDDQLVRLRPLLLFSRVTLISAR